jgi:signal transduction histidine kinase
MNLDSACFVIYKREKKQFVAIAQEGLDNIFAVDEDYIRKSLGVNDHLIEALKLSKDIIVRDEIVLRGGQAGERIATQMDSIGAFISIPFFINRQLTAILNVGRKISGDMFNGMDFDLFKELMKTGESHLAHAMFMENSIFFSGNVAHDLRSPFKYGIMDDYLDDIALGFENKESVPQAKDALSKLKNRLNMVHKMADIMVDVHENVKRFVLGNFKPEQIDYAVLATDIVDSFRKNKQSKDINLDLVIGTEKPMVCGESLDIQRVLSELVTNAFKYTQKGRITVEISTGPDGEIITCVADTGKGIPNDKLDYIFDPFVRVKNGDGDDKGGSGLGLASIRQLLDANGGRIWVKSKEGSGSQFFFMLPAWN